MKKVLFAVLAFAAAGEVCVADAQERELIINVNDTSVPNPEYIATWADPHWDRTVNYVPGTVDRTVTRTSVFGIQWGIARGIVNAQDVIVYSGGYSYEESFPGDTRIDVAETGYRIQEWTHAGLGGRVSVGATTCSVRPNIDLLNAQASGQVALTARFEVSCPPVDVRAMINFGASTAGGEVFTAMTIPIAGAQVPIPLVTAATGEGSYTDIVDAFGNFISSSSNNTTVTCWTYSRIICIADGNALILGDEADIMSNGFGATRATTNFGHD